MIEKTSGIEFQKFGAVYSEPFAANTSMYVRIECTAIETTICNLHTFNRQVCVEVKAGMGNIVIGTSCSHEDLKRFAIHRNLMLHPDTYFAIIPLTRNLQYSIIAPKDYVQRTVLLESPLVCHAHANPPVIHNIMGYYYGIKQPGYRFKGEQHNYYELTFVDHGTLQTVVENTEYTLQKNEYLFYAPLQFHNQRVIADVSCSYITILFEMDLEEGMSLANQVFTCDNERYAVMKKFIEASAKTGEYTQLLLDCYLLEFVTLTLSQPRPKAEQSVIQSNTTVHFQDEILTKILAYMDESVYEFVTVSEICNKFSVSRSFLQTLFKKSLNTTPKNYMLHAKLVRSKELIADNKYTISKIALMLGFSSIHYFSRTFKKHFDISPGEYAKKIYKD